MKKLFIILCVLLIGVMSYGGYVANKNRLHEITDSIKWQSSSDSQTRFYHIRGTVATGQMSQMVAIKLLSIDGVQSVVGCDPKLENMLTPYCFLVTLSPLYSWSEIDSRIASITDNVQQLNEYYKEVMPQTMPEGGIKRDDS